jgi:hypothetical protein
MLADSVGLAINIGSFGKELQLGVSFKKELIKFIATQLPRWRDLYSETDTAENSLTSGLSAHLTSVARHSAGWDSIQFRVEVPDEKKRGRKIDLAPSPCGAIIWIEGRQYSDQDMLFPIECKRLPTPIGASRDEREYVFSGKSSTGGIQRFKAGHHGASHNFGAMIAYVQNDSAEVWHQRIQQWIDNLESLAEPGWSSNDRLLPRPGNPEVGITLYESSHSRVGLANIELHHMWIGMKHLTVDKDPNTLP